MTIGLLAKGCNLLFPVDIAEGVWYMEDFGKWVLEHNPQGRGEYILSLIGVMSYFTVFTLFMGDVSWQVMGLLAFLIVLASWNAGRYCMNRFLYIKDVILLDGERGFSGKMMISSVLRFHAFDVEKYFAGLRKKIYVPIAVILICMMFSAGELLFEGKDCTFRIVVLLFTGMISVVMVYAAYLMKKRQIIQEMQKPTDSVGRTWLTVCSIIFAGIEIAGAMIGLLVAGVFLWTALRID